MYTYIYAAIKLHMSCIINWMYNCIKPRTHKTYNGDCPQLFFIIVSFCMCFSLIWHFGLVRLSRRIPFVLALIYSLGWATPLPRRDLYHVERFIHVYKTCYPQQKSLLMMQKQFSGYIFCQKLWHFELMATSWTI